MSQEKINGLINKYNINFSDFNKLQNIIDSINVAREYGIAEKLIDERKSEKNQVYGIGLSNNENLEKAYPLWVAYVCANSSNPYIAIKNKLKADGMSDKYTPEYIIGLIDYTNIIMNGKTEMEKRDFYMSTISDILSDKNEKTILKDEVEI